MGAWIETIENHIGVQHFSSHPTWVRGLKPVVESINESSQNVAPYVGAWIETFLQNSLVNAQRVAPYVGAWIETFLYLVDLVRK